MRVPDYLRKSRGKRHSRPVQFSRVVLWLALMAFLATACTFPGTNVAPVTTNTHPAPPGPTLGAAPTDVEVCFMEADAIAAIQFAQTKIVTLLPGATVIWYDGFSCDELGAGWTLEKANPTLQMGVADGFLSLRSQKVEQLWDGVGRSSATLVADQAVLVLFQYEAGTTAPLFIYVGDWQTDNYLRAGLIINNDVENTWQIWEGQAFLSFPIAPNVLRPDTPFYLMIRLSNDGQVTMKV